LASREADVHTEVFDSKAINPDRIFQQIVRINKARLFCMNKRYSLYQNEQNPVIAKL